MSRLDGIPVIVKQMGDGMLDNKSPHYVRFNQMITIQNIKDYCEKALSAWDKEQKKGW